MSIVWELPLNSNEKITLLAIADNANDDGYAYPGYAKLMSKTGLAKATLSKHLKILRGAGIFAQESHSSIGKGRKVNTYQIDLDFLISSSTELIEEKVKESRRVHQLNYSTFPRKVQSTISSIPEPISSMPEHEPSFKPSLLKERQRKKTAQPRDYELAHWIYGKILDLNPKHREPKFGEWANTIRLMRERDELTHREIAELFQWANEHDFWKTNILSPAKLRAKWDDLIIQRDHGNEKSNRLSPAAAQAKRFSEQCRQAAAAADATSDTQII